MRIHHLNCATMCPVAFGLLGLREMVCHCLLVETPSSGLVLVDTGFGTGDVTDPSHLGRAFGGLVRPKLDITETAIRQVEALGYAASDVRHILPTHLDLDHAGGLPDFPKAKVHIYRPELDAATARATWKEKERYKARHVAHGPDWQPYELAGETWNGFECVRDLVGLPPEVLLVPTVGHTRGHVAVAVQSSTGWLLHAGDAYFHHRQMDPERPSCPVPLAIFQSTMAIDDVARRRSSERLRLLARDTKVTVFSAHDVNELEASQAARPTSRTEVSSVREA
jgi:glyoxylase-like metal-dependent hydrolase (beta-lactamase superfamily II)